jgi:hypothetical protein
VATVQSSRNEGIEIIRRKCPKDAPASRWGYQHQPGALRRSLQLGF